MKFKTVSICVRQGHAPGKYRFEGYAEDGRLKFAQKCTRCRTVVCRMTSAQPIDPGAAPVEYPDSGVVPMGLPTLEGEA